MHQILLKYCFSEEVASFQVTVPFGVMLFFLFFFSPERNQTHLVLMRVFSKNDAFRVLLCHSQQIYDKFMPLELKEA